VPPSGFTPGCGTGGEKAEAPPAGRGPGGGGIGVSPGVAAIGAVPTGGIGAPPIAMGATPTIVPFSLLGTAPAPGGGSAPGGPGRAGGGAPGAGGEDGMAPG
jgi:hypothetical protein